MAIPLVEVGGEEEVSFGDYWGTGAAKSHIRKKLMMSVITGKQLGLILLLPVSAFSGPDCKIMKFSYLVYMTCWSAGLEMSQMYDLVYQSPFR